MGRADDILKELSSLREEDVLCDVQLQAEGQTISAHKVVLAAASPYFKAMFSGKFKERKAHIVEIKEVSFQGLKDVVDSIYHNKINLIMKNIEDVVPAAHMLEMTDIINESKEWMLKKITKASCFKLLELAEKYGIENVVDRIHEFVLQNFVAVSESKAFKGISKEILIKYVSADTLKTNINEFAVYKAVKSWILSNEIPQEGVTEIMSHVRFGLIAPETILKDISRDSLIDKNEDCRRMIDDAMLYHSDQYTQPLYKGNLNKPRGKRGVLIIPQGRRSDGYNVSDTQVSVNFITFPSFENSPFSSSLKVPFVCGSMNSIQINNFLYVFGINCTGYQNFTKRYDASLNKWMELAAVPTEATIGSTVAYAGTHIFHMGGMSVAKDCSCAVREEKLVDNMSAYNICENAWSESTALPTKLVYGVACQLEGRIFLTGGYSGSVSDGGETLSKVWEFDVKGKIWLTKAPMNEKRCQHVLEALNGKLYAVGGREIGGEKCCMIEEYDVSTNQWSVLMFADLQIQASSSFINARKIYMIGGVYSNFDVLIYDVDKNELVERDSQLPSNCERNISAYLTLPKLL